MLYTPLLQKALSFAIRVHELEAKAKRKGTDIPYITHPLAVAIILARTGAEENVIAAGLLHDTIEDCEPYGSVTKALLAKEFNPQIAEIVNDVTEQDKSLPWKERKAAALAHIKDMGHDSLLVKSADVLHNLQDLNNDIEKNGSAVFEKFNAGKEATIGRYRKLCAELKTVWGENPLVADLEAGLERLLELTKSR